MNLKMRFELTKNTIECADNIDENWDLFHKSIALLEKRILNEDFSEFSLEEQELLEETFIKLEEE